MEKLVNIQKGLKAPKSQRNNFGKYNYRSCEDILEAVKPLLAENKCILLVSDEVVQVADRIYIKATATIKGKDLDLSVSAFAREPQIQKGMSDSQITGSASSYARKYALNGLFAIDDNKDADDDSNHSSYGTNQPKLIDVVTIGELAKLVDNKGLDLMAVLSAWSLKNLGELQTQSIPAFKAWVNNAK